MFQRHTRVRVTGIHLVMCIAIGGAAVLRPPHVSAQPYNLYRTISAPLSIKYGATAVGTQILVGVFGGQPPPSVAYLFDGLTGALLQTFPDPHPVVQQDQFAVIGTQNELALIGTMAIAGAPCDNTAGPVCSGSVYVFDAASGTLLLRFSDPDPNNYDDFGFAMAAMGSNLLVNSAADNAVRLYDPSTGTALAEFLNPEPGYFTSGNFGIAVAPVGPNVVVGGIDCCQAPRQPGVAYLFDGNTQALLLRIASPNPSSGDERFGETLTAVGTDILVADSPATDPGAAYLFDGTTGALVHTFQSPNPTAGDMFGVTLAASNGTIVVGAPSEGKDGAVHLFDANGTLIQSIVAPISPVMSGDGFGSKVAMMGSTGRDIVVAYPNAGALYVYDTCGSGIISGTEQCDDDNLIDGDGCDHTCQIEPATASDTPPPGGTVTTDPGAHGATAAQPVQTAVTTPTGGTVSITTTGTEPAPPPGYEVLTTVVQISAPAETSGSPLVLAFEISASLIPPGADSGSLQVFKDGTAVPSCTGPPGVASPDPCVASQTVLGDGNVQINILTSTASAWNVATSMCSPQPRAGCVGALAGKAAVDIQKGDVSAHDLVSWKWKSSGAVTTSDLGTLTTRSPYAFCVYDTSAGSRLRVTIPIEGLCSGSKCWKETRTALKYASKVAPTGLQSVKLQAGAAGKAKISLKGKGSSLGLPASVALTAPVRIQLQRREGSSCWEAAYSAPTTDVATEFHAKSD